MTHKEHLAFYLAYILYVQDKGSVTLLILPINLLHKNIKCTILVNEYVWLHKFSIATVSYLKVGGFKHRYLSVTFLKGRKPNQALSQLGYTPSGGCTGIPFLVSSIFWWLSAFTDL
jgi:hypothetical protein